MISAKCSEIRGPGVLFLQNAARGIPGNTVAMHRRSSQQSLFSLAPRPVHYPASVLRHFLCFEQSAICQWKKIKTRYQSLPISLYLEAWPSCTSRRPGFSSGHEESPEDKRVLITSSASHTLVTSSCEGWARSDLEKTGKTPEQLTDSKCTTWRLPIQLLW